MTDYQVVFNEVRQAVDINHKVLEIEVNEVESITVGEDDGYLLDGGGTAHMREIIIYTKSAGLIVLYCMNKTHDKVAASFNVETDAESLAAIAKEKPLPTAEEVALKLKEMFERGELDEGTNK